MTTTPQRPDPIAAIPQAMREMTAEEIIAALGLDDERLHRALMAIERAKKAALRTPNFTRLVLVSEDLLSFLGTRDENGDRLTFEWGERRPEGWYEPAFTRHADDNLVADTIAALDALTAERDAEREALRTALKAYEANPVNVFDRPSSWRVLEELLDAARLAAEAQPHDPEAVNP